MIVAGETTIVAPKE